MSRPGILVVARAPVAGEAKTRLAAAVGPERGAALAAAALLDTLETCETIFGTTERVVAMTGDLREAARSDEITSRLEGWRVIGQRGEGLAQRLAHAHADAANTLTDGVLQIGMDTPQVTPGQLDHARRELDQPHQDAVIGPAEDGGWWLLGLRNPVWAEGLADVPMSTAGTARATLRMLTDAGARVALTAALVDVDTSSDARTVRRAAPGTRFALAWDEQTGNGAGVRS